MLVSLLLTCHCAPLLLQLSEVPVSKRLWELNIRCYYFELDQQATTVSG